MTETLFGLPEEVRYCRTCVISNQRPNSAVEFKHTRESIKATIAFDETGQCDACRFAGVKDSVIDWGEREEQLQELARRVEGDGTGFNCIVPGSGGKDSFYQAHILRHRYGFRPLTVTWAPHIYTDWGWRNFQRWIHSGFDNLLTTPNGMVHRLLTRLAVENLFHPFQPFILGQKNLAPKMARLLRVPLIFYGENEAEYGNPIADTEQAQREFDYFAAEGAEAMYLGGVSVADLMGKYGLAQHDLASYLPEDPSALVEAGVEVHYLGYYLRWHPQGAYYYAVENGGFEPSPERTPGTYSKYNSIDDKVDDLHYWTTFVKFGIGRATYDAAQEIRSGDITREEGVALVRRFDGEWPARFQEELMAYLSVDPRLEAARKAFADPEMTLDMFLALADSFRSPHLWRRSGDAWELRHQVT